MVFSRSRDGASYKSYFFLPNPFSLLQLCDRKGELLFVVQDTQDFIFGGFFTQHLEFKSEYYGTGESFLFQVTVRIFS